MFRSLGNRMFRLWYVGALLSNAAFWAQSTAISWIVLTELTDHDTFAVGIALALQFGPQVLLAPLTGHLTDRYPRRRILQITQLAWTALGLAMGALLLFGAAELWHVFVFMALFGTVNSFDAPARQAFVSDLVAPALVPNAVALNSASFNASRLLGPGAAGLLIAVFGAGPVFLANAGAYLVLFVVLARITPQHELLSRRGSVDDTTESVGPVRYLLGRSDLLGVFFIAFLVGMFGMNFPIISSAMTLELDGDNVALYGIFSSLLGAGSMFGALYAATLKQVRLRFISISLALFSLSYAIAAVMPSPLTFGIAVFPVGFFLVAVVSSLNSYVQVTCEPRLRGRVLAIYLAVLFGGTPIGGPVQGWLCDMLGARSGFVTASTAAAIALLVSSALFLKHRRERSNPAP